MRIVGSTQQIRPYVEKFAAWPDKHPGTQEPFTECTAFQVDPQDEVYHYNAPLRPSEPSREVPDEWMVDDDGEEYPVSYRRLSEDEYEKALEDYQKRMVEWQKAVEKWRKNNGTHVVAGPVIIDGTFRTQSGATATGTFGDKKWHWRSYTFSRTAR